METATPWRKSESYLEDSQQDVVMQQSPSAYPPETTEEFWEEVLMEFDWDESGPKREAPLQEFAELVFHKTRESSESMAERVDPRLQELFEETEYLGKRRADEKHDFTTQPERTSQNPVIYVMNFVAQNTDSILQHFSDHKIYLDGLHGDLSPPQNLPYIKGAFSRRRASLSRSETIQSQFRGFQQSYTRASPSCSVDYTLIPILEGKRNKLEVVLPHSPLYNFLPLTGGTVSAPIPYETHGARSSHLLPQLRRDLDRYIAPTIGIGDPVAPNFFLESDPLESETIVRIRVAYMGALGARAMQSLRDYMEDNSFLTSRAMTITSVYHSGQLKLFAHHIKRPSKPGARPEYIMTLINSWSMADNLETFLEGVTWYRNARDWARERRDEFIRYANMKLVDIGCRESPPMEERAPIPGRREPRK